MNDLLLTIAFLALLPLASCTHKVQVEPVKVEPIHLTIDINVRVERELDDFFDFEDDASDTDADAADGETTS